MRMKSLALVILLILSSCTSPESPSKTYEEYNRRVITGLEFTKEKEYFTTKKNAEIESKFPQYMKQMNKSREKVIEFYVNFSQSVAKCKEISLVEERIDGDKAFLLYEQKDICGNSSTVPEKQSVRMINENGWKIDEVEISL